MPARADRHRHAADRCRPRAGGARRRVLWVALAGLTLATAGTAPVRAASVDGVVGHWCLQALEFLPPAPDRHDYIGWLHVPAAGEVSREGQAMASAQPVPPPGAPGRDAPAKAPATADDPASTTGTGGWIGRFYAADRLNDAWALQDLELSLTQAGELMAVGRLLASRNYAADTLLLRRSGAALIGGGVDLARRTFQVRFSPGPCHRDLS